MSTTFEGLYIARSGVQTARSSLNVTGQNISNANTTGYTRQRVDQSAVSPSGANSLYASSGAVNGEGVTATGISQLRNSYLDAQYRTQYAKCGASSTLYSGLSSIEQILNESTTDGLSAQLGNLLTQLQGMTSSGNGSATESTVKNAASLLTTFFNTAASNLDSTQSTQLGYLSENAVGQANILMRDISSLNQQIKSANIAGMPALELLDQRNNKIDELSQYMNIKVSEVDNGNISVKGQPVTDLNISLVDASGTEIRKLVSNDQYVQLKVSTSSADSTYPYGKTTVEATSIDSPSTYTDLADSDFSSGEIHGYLELLNDSGEFDGTTTRGIGYYKQVLDETAQKFADLMNKANSTNDAQDNCPLFTTSGGATTGITADNITVASAWAVGQNYFHTTKKAANAGDSNTAGTDNIEAMVSLLEGDSAVTIDAGGSSIFTGSMQGAVDDISLKLGQDIGSLKSQDEANSNTIDNIDAGRQEISSVDINDEAINLIQYNQALTASARFMTTVDEVLDTIISNMGIAGR